jgi:hypothetical protein
VRNWCALWQRQILADEQASPAPTHLLNVQ